MKNIRFLACLTVPTMLAAATAACGDADCSVTKTCNVGGDTTSSTGGASSSSSTSQGGAGGDTTSAGGMSTGTGGSGGQEPVFRRTRISLGDSHSCALLAGDAPYCWGNGFAAAVNANNVDALVPTKVAWASSSVDIDLSLTYDRNYILQQDGSVRYWDYGAGPEVLQLIPALVAADFTGSKIVNQPPDREGCGVTTNGDVACWGAHPGDTDSDPGDVDIMAGVEDAVDVGIGCPAGHACALESDGTVKCWGKNADGALGLSLPDDQIVNAPTAVPLPGHATQIAVACVSTCAVLDTGALYCWGRNAGIGGTQPQFAPVQVPLQQVLGVHHSNFNACAYLETGQAYCWGSNQDGSLGNGTTSPSFTPVQVIGLDAVVDIATNQRHSCAREADGSLYCWGFNFNGQLGNNSTASSVAPVPVAYP